MAVLIIANNNSIWHNRSGATFAVVAGERELADGIVQLKDLRSGDQRPVGLDALVTELRTGQAP